MPITVKRKYDKHGLGSVEAKVNFDISPLHLSSQGKLERDRINVFH